MCLIRSSVPLPPLQGLETQPTAVLDNHIAVFESPEQAGLDQQAERGASQSGGHAAIGSGQSDLEKTAAEVVGARAQQKLVLPEAAAAGAGRQAAGAGKGSASGAAAGGTAMGTRTGVAGDPREAADSALQAEDAAAQAVLLTPAGGMAAENQVKLADMAVGAAGGDMDAQSRGGGQEAVQGDPEALAELQGETTTEAAVRDASAAAAGRAASAHSMRAEAEAEPLAEAEPRAGAAKSAGRDGSAMAANAAAAADIVLADAAGAEPKAQAAEAAAATSGADASSVAAAAQSVLAEGAAAEGVEEAAALDTQSARRVLMQRRQVWAHPGISASMSL